jgi:3-oxoadipate enol-lactonase
VKDAVTVMDALGLKRVHFAGFESGGVVGMLLAAQHPERVASLACFNTPFRDSTARSAAGGVFANGYASPGDAIDAMGFEAWVDHLMAHDILIDRGDAARSAWVARQAKRVPASVAKPWHSVFWEAAPRIAELPARITAPVLLVAGEQHAHGCQPPLLDNLRKRLRRAREVVYIPDVAIGVQLLAPEASAAVYLDFLESLP